MAANCALVMLSCGIACSSQGHDQWIRFDSGKNQLASHMIQPPLAIELTELCIQNSSMEFLFTLGIPRPNPFMMHLFGIPRSTTN